MDVSKYRVQIPNRQMNQWCLELLGESLTQVGRRTKDKLWSAYGRPGPSGRDRFGGGDAPREGCMITTGSVGRGGLDK